MEMLEDEEHDADSSSNEDQKETQQQVTPKEYQGDSSTTKKAFN